MVLFQNAINLDAIVRLYPGLIGFASSRLVPYHFGYKMADDVSTLEHFITVTLPLVDESELSFIHVKLTSSECVIITVCLTR